MTAPVTPTSTAVSARRIRFLDQAPPGARVRRAFKHPRPCVAVEEVVALADLPKDHPWPEPTDQLLVLCGAGAEAAPVGSSWLAPPDDPDAAPPVEFKWAGHTIRWRPGRAVILGRGECPDDVLAALIDFAFYEGQLRNLEQALEAGEAEAPDDVARAHRIREVDRPHWQRLGAKIEYFARLRLAYARLEPRLAKGSRTLPTSGRRVMNRLLVRADVLARLEALSDRLEACEDLYEGANDRVADYRWYRTGYLLEVGIVFFLLLEVVLMGAELYLRYIELYMD